MNIPAGNKLVIRSFTALFCLMTMMTVALAQTPNWQWRNLTTAQSPAPEARRNGVAIYDPVGKRLIVFGGTGNSGLLNDTWAFSVETRTWAKLNTTGITPPERFGFDAVYDPVEHQLVIYSGQGSSFFNDTWTLNLQTLEWRDVSPASQTARPKKRYGSASIFDPVTRSLVQFAGFTSEAGRFQDTQSFSLADKAWTDWTPGGDKPQVRCLLTAAYDHVQKRMVIYGGQRSGTLDDLWTFNLATRTWTNLTPTTRPAGRWFANSFVDRDGRFLLFGGYTNNGNSNELWSFDLDARQWTPLSAGNGPTPRNGAMSAYDESANRWFVFGGTGNNLLNEVWELSRPAAPTSVATVSAASFSGEQLAAEAIVAAFGVNLASATQVATITPLPTELAGTRAVVRDSAGSERTAPLFFVSPVQINFLIPAGTAQGAATLTVFSQNNPVATGSLAITAVAPSLFSANASGQGVPAAIAVRVKADGTQRIEAVAEWNATLNRFVATPLDLGPEQEQLFLVLFGTGLRYHSGLSNVTARLGGTDAWVSFAGAQGDLVGLDQVNVRLPRSLSGRGAVDVALSVDGRAANVVQVMVK